MGKIADPWISDMLKGCTFDDFLIAPGWGIAQSRKDICLKSRFSENINLNIPIVSANMDTITGARMAVTMAKHGGIGIIHRYLSIEDQCEKVEEVKREENLVIGNPYSIGPDATIAEAAGLMNKNKVGGLVVLNHSGKLLGILTERDVRFCGPDKLVRDRMNGRGRLITAGPGITLLQAKQLMDMHRLKKLPLTDKRFKLKGLITSRDIKNLEDFPLANKDKNGQLMVGAAIGATGDYLERSAELVKAGADVIVLDIANSQSNVGARAVQNFRKRFPDMELVVGNIALPEAAGYYSKAGANGLKVGLGPGSACTTRINTNIGVTQAQAVYDCSVNSEVPVNADGGIKRHGHIALALILGASSVMIGGMFAGTDESPGLVFRGSSGKKVKRFRGMASREAMHDKLRAEQLDDPYESSSRISPEGMEKDIEYRGSVVPVLNEIMGHLASTVSYIGARSLNEARDLFMSDPKKYLIKISESAKRESWDR